MKHIIVSKFGFHSIVDENGTILANYKDLNTAEAHLNDINKRQKNEEN
jgi:hypothetical protein